MFQIELSSPMLWSVSGVARYESSWMAFHRFLWMNAINGPGLWRKMIGSDRLKLPMPSSRYFPEQYIDIMSKYLFIKDFFSHFENRSFAACFGAKNAELICSTHSLRYCPLCLNNCFHSPYFQFALIEECPYHHVPLIMECLHCGRALGVPQFFPGNFSHPMCCQSCQRNLIDGHFSWQLVAGSSKGIEEFSQIENSMEKLRNIQFAEEYRIPGDPWSPKAYKKICQSIAGLAIDRKYLVSGGLRISEEWDNSKVAFSSDYLIERGKFTIFDEVEVLIPIAKSINRHITKRIRSICGHKKTSKLPWTTHDRPFSPAEPVLSARLDDCPCCALLDQWRAYAGKLIALRNIIRERRPVYDDSNGYIRTRYCLLANILAESLISSFSWFVCSFCDHMDCLLEEFSPYWFFNDKIYLDMRVPTNIIRFDTFRFNMQMFGYIMQDANDKEIFVALSLRGAFERIKKYHDDVYSLKFKSDSLKDCIDMDDWYTGMSENFISKESRSWRHVPP